MSNAFYDSWDDLLAAKTHVEGDCLIWDAGCHSQGYPMVRWDNKMVMVKRQMIENKLNIKLVRSQRIRSNGKCDNIRCVNPDHYSLIERDQEEWKCYRIAYDDELRQEVADIYEHYSHPKTGTKSGAIPYIKKHQKTQMATGTIRRILKELNIFPDYLK